MTIKEQVLLAYYTQYNNDVSKMFEVHYELSKNMDNADYNNAMIQLVNEFLMDGIEIISIPGSGDRRIKVLNPMITSEGIRVIEDLLNIPEDTPQTSKFAKIKDAFYSFATEITVKAVSDYLYRVTSGA